MTRKEEKNLRRLLTVFDAAGLGEGDEIAGANTLAAMACTLAAVARPGSGLLTREERLIPVGSNLLVTGALNASLVADEVITPLGFCQNNLLSHLLRLLKDEERESRKSGAGSRVLRGESPPSPSEGTLTQLVGPDPLLPCTHKEAWAEVVGIPPSRRFEDLTTQPRVFITAAKPEELGKLLAGAHCGQPLVHLGIVRAADFGRFGDLCAALMGGRIAAGPAGESVRGRLLVTDPGGVLHEAAAGGGDRSAWLGHLCWLVGGDAGPGTPELPPDDGILRLGNVAIRFNRALHLAWGARLDSANPRPVVRKVDFTEFQERWIAFLNEMEKSLPGIAGTARNLLATLVFGFRELAGAAAMPEGFKYYLADIGAFARFLIRRMANARAAILFSAKDAWREKLRSRILAKLAGGRLGDRDIYRALGIPALLCGELLLELEAGKEVRRADRKWERIAPNVPGTGERNHLALEI